MAGSGKSTIARTIAHEFRRLDRLGASFFFSRNTKDRADASNVISTLAVQLTEFSTDLKQNIRQVVDKHPHIADTAKAKQWQQLIFTPLSMLESSRTDSSTTVIVIDALDECGDQEDVKFLLLPLANMNAMATVKVLITSRP